VDQEARWARLYVAAELSKRGIPNALLPENFCGDDLVVGQKDGDALAFVQVKSCHPDRANIAGGISYSKFAHAPKSGPKIERLSADMLGTRKMPTVSKLARTSIFWTCSDVLGIKDGGRTWIRTRDLSHVRRAL
jgi:hypothetical protein